MAGASAAILTVIQPRTAIKYKTVKHFDTIVGRRHVFGLRTDLRDGVHVLHDGVVLFVAGNCVVLHAMEARTQVLLLAERHGDDIACPAHALRGCRCTSQGRECHQVTCLSDRRALTISFAALHHAGGGQQGHDVPGGQPQPAVAGRRRAGARKRHSDHLRPGHPKKRKFLMPQEGAAKVRIVDAATFNVNTQLA